MSSPKSFCSCSRPASNTLLSGRYRYLVCLSCQALHCLKTLLYASPRVNTIPCLRLQAGRSIFPGFRLNPHHEWPSLISRMRRLPVTNRDPPHTQQKPTKNIPSVTCGMPDARRHDTACTAGCKPEASSCELRPFGFRKAPKFLGFCISSKPLQERSVAE